MFKTIKSIFIRECLHFSNFFFDIYFILVAPILFHLKDYVVTILDLYY